MRCLSLLTVRQDYLSGKRLCTLESGCPLTLCERKREEKEGGSGEKKKRDNNNDRFYIFLFLNIGYSIK